MCGIEKAGFEQDPEAMERAIRKDVMLHAYMFLQSGIPVLYGGDEIAQVNDYTYKEDPDKARLLYTTDAADEEGRGGFGGGRAL